MFGSSLTKVQVQKETQTQFTFASPSEVMEPWVNVLIEPEFLSRDSYIYIQCSVARLLGFYMNPSNLDAFIWHQKSKFHLGKHFQAGYTFYLLHINDVTFQIDSCLYGILDN